MRLDEKIKRLRQVKNIRDFKRFLYSHDINWRHFWHYYYLFTVKGRCKINIFLGVLSGHYDSVLLYAFPWLETKEGYKYWQEIEVFASDYTHKKHEIELNNQLHGVY